MALSDGDTRAVELFEQAIEKEQHGLMLDAVRFYREAFKLNEKVDMLYRQEKVPETIRQLQKKHGKNVARRVDEAEVRKINVDKLLRLWEHEEARAPDPEDPDSEDLAIRIGNINLNTHPVFGDKPAPITDLSGEVWTHVLEILLHTDPEAWFALGMACKKFAYLAFGTLAIWRLLARLVYPKQVYEENKGLRKNLPVPKDPEVMLPQYNHLWRQMIRERPYVKFYGCYISVVNYYSEGARDDNSLLWTNPVKSNTYYRYLRCYPDGQCVMALLTLDPPKVIPHLLRENPTKCIVDLPDLAKFNPEKYPHKIYLGFWSITTDGHVLVEITQGSVPYYTFHYQFQIKSLGGVLNHSKLAWVQYYAVRKRMRENDDREGEVVQFSLKNECAFKFSRVRLYTLEN